MAEISGNAPFIMPAAINCAAPDTGNMEVFARYGTPAQQKKYLLPLLDGKIRSAFAMTEPGVASSDATNLQRTRIEKAENGDVVINGRKWVSLASRLYRKHDLTQSCRSGFLERVIPDVQSTSWSVCQLVTLAVQ